MYTLIVKSSFEAAHTIPDHPGKCKHLHGHSYRVEAEFTGKELDALGMVCDFDILKRALQKVLPDHTYLNEVLDGPTTAEYLSAWIFQKLKDQELPVSAVTVWETEHGGCRYSPR